MAKAPCSCWSACNNAPQGPTTEMTMKTNNHIQSATRSLACAGCLWLFGLCPGLRAQAIDAAKPAVPDGYQLIEGDIQVPKPPEGIAPFATTYSTDLWPDGD